MRVPKRLNILHIGLCNWSTNFNICGCDLPRGHHGPHHVSAATGLPPTLTTREQQEAWVRDRAKALFGDQAGGPRDPAG